MPTLTSFAETDGIIISTSSVYSTARAGNGLSASQDTFLSLSVGQEETAGNYQCYESFLSFDTSSIPDASTISSAVCSVYVVLDGSDVDFTVELRMSDWGATLTTADWVAGASLGGLTLAGTFSTTGLSTGAYKDFSDTAMSSNINKTGSTRMLVNGSTHRTGSTPGAGVQHRIDFRSQINTGTSQDPKLVVIYSDPATTKTATFDAVLANRTTKTATFDMVAAAVVAKTLDLDAVVADEFTKSFDWSAVLASQPTLTATFDALMTDRPLLTLDWDSVLEGSVKRFLDWDTLIEEGHVKTASWSAVMAAVESGALTWDSLLAPLVTASVDWDVSLRLRPELTASWDAVLRLVHPQTIMPAAVVDRGVRPAGGQVVE